MANSPTFPKRGQKLSIATPAATLCDMFPQSSVGPRNRNLMFKMAALSSFPRIVILLFSLSFLCPNVHASGEEYILNSEIGRLNNQSLLWGSYRPNLYFGVRPRLPHSVMAGLMWSRVEKFEDVQNNLRYTCEQHQGMAGYGWDEYDPRQGGIQTIHDAGNSIDITTSFVKIPGGNKGGSWAARIKGVPRDGALDSLKTMVMFYITQEGLGSTLEVVDTSDPTGFDGDVTLNGNSEDLGDYNIVITKGTGDHPPPDSHAHQAVRDGEKTVVQSLNLPNEHLWQAKAVVFRQFKEGLDNIVEKYGPEDAPPPYLSFQLENRPAPGNVHMVQKFFQGEFEFDILFSSDSAGKGLTSRDVDREILTVSESFGERFSRIFALKTPYNADTYKKFARSMFSNLIGGIGYFYGHHLVDRSYAPEYDEEIEGFWEEAAEARARHEEALEGPFELFTSIPSRPFFPRGFLWDEGFHLMPIADWDIDLTLEIVRSWYNLMDDEGWIAREQILGAEARSKVPPEFQVQYPHYANPPTLFLVLDTFVDKLQKMNGSLAPPKESLSQGVTLATAHLDNPEVGLELLRQLYPLLKRQFNWFRRTQNGDIKSYDREAYSTKEAYRWRGRTVEHILTSGLDDYPRPQPPHPGELHLDLMSWMGMMTKSLINISSALGMPEEAESYKKVLNAIEHNLVDLHWSEEEGCFCDATIDDYEEHQLVCHKGYMSLFPFMTGLIKPDDSKMDKILDLISDKEELFSLHGIRSLSKKSEFYGTNENYWRSPVWINMNFLTVQQLQNLGQQEGPYQKRAQSLFNQLRENLVNTVFESWKETGFAWEQYNPETGEGQRTQHFTGWTSLVVKIMAMEPFEEGHVKDEL
ncbi:putative glycoside hydrolase family 63 protein [Zalerion maritima]|uniref:Mannosyl-oligosaccharide glucosidase n=1 Tax=Zalerion maritima TaxID=339359 RepID=A0AAD5RVX5_9PEZI|nr:putative glycoside hydrolase family 63 protein [Zalerion maritima]